MVKGSPTRRSTDMHLCALPLSLFAPLFTLHAEGGQSQKFLLLGISLCVVVVGLWIFFALRTRRERVAASLAKSNVIRERLQQVLDADGRLEMFPAQRTGNANGQMLIGRCLACSNDSLDLEFALTAEVSSWKHEVVDVYFRLNVDHEYIFYVFTATIRSSQVYGSKLRIEMPLPVHLRKEQKRALFRVSLPSSMVLALALWNMDAETKAGTSLVPRSLGVPLLTGRAGKHRNLTLCDISGGGMCLEIDKERARELNVQYKPGDNFIMLTVFANREGEAEPRQFWFKCLCRHMGSTVPGANPRIGLQFRAWCVSQNVSDSIEWIPLTTADEVPPLLEMLVEWSRSASKNTV